MLYQMMMGKLKGKVEHPGVINKAIRNEQKVIYKYRDVEEELVRGVASQNVLGKIRESEVMRAVGLVAQKVREAKPKAVGGKKKVSIVESP